MYAFEILHAAFDTTTQEVEDAFYNAFNFDVVGKITQGLTEEYGGSWKKFLVEFKDTPGCINALFAPTVEFHSASATYYKLYYTPSEYWIAYLITIPPVAVKSLPTEFADLQLAELQSAADILFA